MTSSLNQITVLNQPVQIWGGLEFGVRSLALCCHCCPLMRTPLVCNFYGVLPNIKLSYTPLSSANTHYSTVRIQYSTRSIVEDSIVLVIQPQILLNLKSVPVGLTLYFGEDWMPKSTSTKPGTQQLSSASLDATRSSDGVHAARLYHDVSEEIAGWAHRIDIRSDIEREKFRLTASSILYEKICCLW